MGDLVAKRWTRYDHDRVYVTTAAGTKVGWRDLKTGESYLDVPELQEQFDIAVATVLGSLPAPGLMPPPQAGTLMQADLEESLEVGGAETPEDHDLAMNRPGQGIREIALEEAAANRERSKLGHLFNRVTDRNTQERSWRVGADGEEAVGGRLEKLIKDGWTVLHSIPVGDRGSDIDHVLIGHGGVYTINTKRHPNKSITVNGDTIGVDGYRQHYVRNSRYEAQRAADLLSDAVGRPVTAKGVLVFLTATLLPTVTIKKQPDDVIVLDRMDIPQVFRKAPQRLSQAEVEAISTAARRPSTWTRRS